MYYGTTTVSMLIKRYTGIIMKISINTFYEKTDNDSDNVTLVAVKTCL